MRYLTYFITRYGDKIILIGALIVALILRLVWLDRFPVSITGDELFYVLSAKALFLTGQGITGTWSPLSALLFHYQPGSAPQAELSYFILLPFVGMFPFSLFLVRLPFALLSVGIVYVLYLFSNQIVSKRTALIVVFLAAVNPWLVVMGRTAYEVTPAMFFYLMGGYLFLKLKEWKILYTLPIFLLAFYSYIGTKIIFLPFIIALCLYTFFVNKENKRLLPYITFLGISLLFIIMFFLTITNNPGNARLGELFLPNDQSLSMQVDAFRKSTISTPVLSLLVNKYSLFITAIYERFGNIFSFSYLFLHGDSFFGLWQQGLFYIVDSVFIVFGVINIWIKKRKESLLLFSLILISCMPQLFYKTPEAFTPHITMVIPFFLILGAYGIEECLLQSKRFSKLLIGGIGIVYVFSVFSFLHIYLFQYPIQGKTDIAVRELSRYITIADDNDQLIIVHSSHSEDLYFKYLFYTNTYTKHTATRVQNNLKKKRYELGKVRFTDCIKSTDIRNSKDIHIVDAICGGKLLANSEIKIVLLTDSGEAFNIYNDTFCSKTGLQPFVSKLTISDFAIEKISPEKFCKNFIIY